MSGTLTHVPTQVLQKLMLDLSLGATKASGSAWPILLDVLPETPAICIVVRDSEPQIQGRTHFLNVLEDEGFQIFVRSEAESAGRAKIQAIKTALDAVDRSTVTIDDSTYLVHCIRRASGPLSVGLDGKRRAQFSLNGYIGFEQTA